MNETCFFDKVDKKCIGNPRKVLLISIPTVKI